MNARIVAVTAITPSVWGTTYIVTTDLLPEGRPLLAAALRALPAGLLLVAATRTLPRGSWWWRSAVLGALNFAAFFSFLFTAAYRLPGGVAATVGAIQPLVVMALAVGLLGERAGATRVVAGFTGMIGVALLVLDGGARLDTAGVAAALAGAGSMAVGSVLVQRWGRPVGPLAFAGWQLTAGGLMLVPIALVGEGLPPALTAGNVAGYAYLATIGGAMAYTIWFRGIAAIGARNATFLSLLSPVVATTIGVATGEAFGPGRALGALIVLASVTVAQVVRTPTPTPPSSPPAEAAEARSGAISPSPFTSAPVSAISSWCSPSCPTDDDERSEQVAVVGVLLDEPGHEPAVRDDGPPLVSDVIERRRHQHVAQAPAAEVRGDLGVRHHHPIALHTEVGHSHDVVIDEELVARAGLVLAHTGFGRGVHPRVSTRHRTR